MIPSEPPYQVQTISIFNKNLIALLVNDQTLLYYSHSSPPPKKSYRKSSVISEVLFSKSQSVWAYMRLQTVTVILFRQQNPTCRIKMKCTCLHWRYLLQDKFHVIVYPQSGIFKSRFNVYLQNTFQKWWHHARVPQTCYAGRQSPLFSQVWIHWICEKQKQS